MDKAQAIHSFWSEFGIPAYDENTVPVGAELPYIAYEELEDSFGYDVPMTASVFYRSSSWNEITQKANQIAENIGAGGRMIAYDGGAVWIKRGSPFIQRMADQTDDSIRRIVVNIEAEYLSND